MMVWRRKKVGEPSLRIDIATDWTWSLVALAACAEHWPVADNTPRSPR
jgi:hypothetical protein